MKSSPFRKNSPLVGCFGIAAAMVVFVLAFCGTSQAQLYWDTNNATTGFGTAGGTWAAPTTNNATQGWSTSSTGSTTLSGTTTTDTTSALNFGSSTNQLGTGTITVSGSVNANSLTFVSSGSGNNVSLSGGNITLGGTTPFITVTNTANASATTQTISSNITLGANQTWTVNAGGSVGTAALNVSGRVSGGFGITKTGNGTLTLNGTNTYTGDTLVSGSGSRINATNASSFGTGNVTITTTGGNNGAFVSVSAAGIFVNNFSINGTGTANGAIQATGNSTLSGLVTLAGDAMIATRTGAGNTNLTLAGGINTSGGSNRTLTLNTFGCATVATNQITISTNSVNLGTGGTLLIGNGIEAGGTGTVNLNVGNNTWGTISVRAVQSAGVSSNATLNLGAANALGGSGAVLQLGVLNTALEGIRVNLNGNNQTIGGLRSFSGNGSASANGTRTVTSATAATLTIDNSSATNYLYDGAISGNISLVKNGTATQTLSGNNTYTGNTTVNNGTLTLSGGTAIADAGTVILANTAGAVLNVNTSETIGSLQGGGATGGNVTIASGQTLTVAEANSNTFSGSLQGSGNLTKSGAGTLTLSGASANTYTGTTTVSAGTLTLDKTSGVVAIGGNLVLNGSSRLVYGASKSEQIADTASITINGSQSVFNGTAWADNVNPNANINETIASLTVTDGQFNTGTTSNWTVTGAGVFDGSSGDARFAAFSGTSISFNSLSLTAMTGTTIVTSADSFVLGGNQPTLTTLTVGSGGLALNGSILSMNLGAVAGGIGSRLILNGNITTTGSSASFIGSYNGTNGTTNIHLSSTAGSVNRTITTGSGANLTISVPITNGSATTAGIIKDGLGTLTLSGNNTYNGTTTVTAGTLATGAANRISDSSAVTVAAGGTFQLGGSETVASIAGAGNYSIGSYTLTSGSSGNPSTTVSGAISGTGGKIEKRGTGTLTLSGNNSFTGDLQVWGGTVSVASIGNVGAISNAGSGNISLGASTTASSLVYTGTGETSNKTIDLAGRGALTLTVNGSDLLRLTSNFTSSGLANKTLTLNGSGSGEIAGAIVDAASGSTALNAQANSGTNQLTLASTVGVVVGAAVSGTGIAPSTTVQSISGSVVTLNNNTTAQINSGGSVTIAGVLNPTALTKDGTGTLILSGVNTFTGGVTINNGTLQLGNAGALNSTAGSENAVSFGASSTGVLSLNGNSIVIKSLNSNATPGTPVVQNANAAAATLTVGNSANAASSYAGVIQDGSGGGALSLTKNGTGTLTLNGSNTYTGTTTINAGILTIQNNSALGTSTGGTVVSNGSVLQLQNNITVTGEALTLSGGGISNAGGSLRSSGNNTWTGNITIGLGSTRIASDADLLTISGNINNAFSTVFQGNGNITVSGIISGGGSVTTSASSGATSVLTLSDNNTFTGQMNITKGIVSVSSIKNFGVASGLGAAASGVIVIGATNIPNGTLLYTGAGDTSNRTFQIGTYGNASAASSSEIGSATIQNDGSGAIVFNATNFNTALNATGGNATNRTLTLSGSNTGSNTISGVIRDNTVSGNATGTARIGLIKSGTGTWILSGANTYSGNTSINTGTLVFRNTAAKSANSTVTVAAAGTLGLGVGNASIDYSNNVVDVFNNGTLTGFTINASSGIALDTTNGDFTLSSDLTAPRALTKLGNNTLTLSGSNTYSGATTVNQGTLLLQNKATRAGGSLVTVAAAGTIGLGVGGGGVTDYSDTDVASLFNNTLSGFALDAVSGVAIDTTAGNFTQSSALTGTRALTKLGSNTLTLSGDNSYTGATTVSAGALNIQHANALGTTAGSTTVSSGAALQLQGGITVGAEDLSLTGTGVSTTGALRNISGGNTYGGAITLAGATRINSDADLLTLSGGIGGTQNLTIGGDGNTTINSAIATSTGTLTKDGAGTLTLSGNNTYTGTTTINAGNLTLTGGSAISNSGAVTLANTAGAILHVAQSETIGTLSGGGASGGDVSIAASQFLTVNSTAGATFSGRITGDGGLVKNGGFSLTLSGNNTYTGGTTLNNAPTNSNSVLLMGSNNALGNGALTINASGWNTFLRLNGTNQTITSLTVLGGNASVIENQGGGNGTMTFNLADGVTSTSTSTFYFRDQSSGNGTLALVKTGNGTLDFSTIHTGSYSGGLTVNQGVFSWNDIKGLGSTSNLITLGGGTLNYTGASGSSVSTTNTNMALTAGTTSTLNNANGTVTISAIIGGSGNLTKSGAGTLMLTGNNTYSGITMVSDGTLQVDSTGLLGGGSYAQNIVNNGTFLYNGTNSQTLSGVISGNGALTKNNASSTLTLSGSNTYTGATTVTAGTLQIGAGGTEGNLSASSSITNNGALVFNRSDTLTQGTDFANIISGSGNITQAGTGTLILSGANTFTGGVTINAGWVQLGSAGALNSTAGSENAVSFGASSTGVLSLNGNSIVIKSLTSNATTPGTPVVQNANATAATLTVGNSANASSTYAGVIQDGTGGGALSLTKAGTGTLTLSGDNTYSGVTTISAGNVTISHANALGATGAGSGTTIASGAALLLSNNINLAETITLNSTGAGGANGGIRSTSGDNTISGAITLGAASRIVVNSGNLTIAGGVNATTNLNLSVGTSASNTSANFTSAITLGSGTLNAYGGNLMNARVVLGFAGNSFAGVRVDTGGTIRTDVANAWNPSANMVLGTSEASAYTNTFDLNGNSQTVASLASANDVSIGGNGGSGNVTNTITSANAATLTVNGSSSTTYRGTITGAISLAKAGSSTLTLTGNNTYTGATTINAGTITLTGSNTGSATAINSGGTLIGTGTAGAVTVNSGGFIGAGSAAATPGTLTVGDLTLNGGGGYTWDLGNVTGTAGANWDLVTATSTTIGADANNKFTIYLNGNPTGWSPATNYASGWNILQWGTLNGTFDANAFVVNSDNFTGAAPAGTWTFNSTGGFLNLSYTAPAATGIWTAGAGNWTTAANWSTVPSNTSPLEFSGSGGVSTNDNMLNTVAGITFTSNATGSYTLNGTALTIRAGGITNNSSSAQTVAMDITMADSQTFNASAANLTVSGAIANAGFNLEASGNNTVAISGAISGSGGLAKIGNGTLVLSGSNSYTGATTVSAGALNIQNNNALGTTAGGTTVASGAALQLQGNITVGAEALSLVGTGVSSTGALRNISGNNTFGGPITMASSTTINSDSGLLTLSGGMSTSSTVTFGGAGSHLVSGNVSGSGSIRASNSTVSLTLTGTNTFTGSLFAEAGTVTISSIGNAGEASAAGAGSTISISGVQGTGTLVYTGSAATSNKTIALSGGPNRSMTITQNGTGLLKFTSNVTNVTSTSYGFRTLVLGGSGSGEMAGAIVDAASGATMTTATAASGSTQLTLASVDGISANSTISGATIANGTTITALNGNIATLSNATTGNVTGFTTILTIPGVTNPTGVTKSGNGNWTLSGANTYSGNTTISAGALNIQHANALGTTARGTTVASGAALQLQGSITVGAEALSLTGNGVSTTGALRNISGSNTYGGAITLAGATRINSDADLLTLSGGIGGTQNLTIGGDGNTTINSAIATTTGSLTKDGTGTLILSGANTYTGTTTISAGNLTLTGGSAISDSGAVTLANASGAILHVAQSETIGNLSGGGASGGDVSIAASQSLTVNSTSATTFSGRITGDGGLVKNGNFTLTLSGNNTYTGGTTINTGTISAGANNALGIGALTINASVSNTFLNLNGTNQTITSLTVLGGSASVIQNQGGGNGTMTFNLADGVTSNSTSMFYFRDQSGGTGKLALVKTGNGTLDFSLFNAANSGYSGGLTVNGGTFSYNSTATTAALGSGSITLGGGTLNYTGNSSRSITNNITLTAGTTSTLNNANSTITVSGTIAGSGNLTKSGAGSLTLSGANTYTGGTTITSGTLWLGADGAIGNGNLTFSPTANSFLNLNGKNQTVTGLTVQAGALAIIQNNLDNTTGTITFDIASGISSTTSNFSVRNQGTNNTGRVAVVKTGAGTLDFSTYDTGRMNYTAGLTVNGGTLSYNATSALGNSTAGGTITLGGGTLNYTGSSSVTIANNATLTADTSSTLNNAAGTVTVSGTIGGSGNLTKSGAGTLALSAANTYNGTTTVNSGTLQAAAAGAMGNSTVINVNGGTLLVSVDDAINGMNITLNGTSTTLAGLAFNGTYSGSVDNLTLSKNSIIDLGEGSVSIMFDTIVMSTYMLDIYNWTGTTLWNGGTGNDTDKVYFGPDLSDAALAKIRFHSGAVGVGDSFLGSGFDLGLKATGFTPAWGHQIIPVPEPETWATGLLLLLGGAVWLWRKRSSLTTQRNLEGDAPSAP